MLDNPDPHTIGALLEAEGAEQAFQESIERIREKKRKAMKKGDKEAIEAWIISQAASMKITADRMRKKYPRSAEILEKARKKLLKLVL